MTEIKYPEKRTFWKVTATGVEHCGFTDNDQVTIAPNAFTMTSDTDATTIYPPLPASGTLIEGDIYSYKGGMVRIEQTHERTIYAPEDTPALFSVYRANTQGAEWVANEKVIAGDERTYAGKTWICLQSHQTLVGWEPEKTPALWKEVVTVIDIPIWEQPAGAHDAYKKGAKVHFPTITDPVYESLIDANVWSPVAYKQGWRKL